MNQLHLIDNMKFMKGIEDNFFPLCIADPQYGISAPTMSNGTNLNRNDGYKRRESTAKRLRTNRLSQGGGKLKDRSMQKFDSNWDLTPPPKEYFEEIFRISKNQIIWGYNYFELPPSRGVICWDKKQPWDNFSQFELAWTSFDKPAAMIRLSNTGGNNLDPKIHPTQKPVKLYEWLLRNYAEEGDVIYDPNTGSGSLVIACMNLGFDIVGCENNKIHYDDSLERISNQTKQGKLKLF